MNAPSTASAIAENPAEHPPPEPPGALRLVTVMLKVSVSVLPAASTAVTVKTFGDDAMSALFVGRTVTAASLPVVTSATQSAEGLTEYVTSPLALVGVYVTVAELPSVTVTYLDEGVM